MKRFRFRGALVLGMMLGVQMVACTGALAIPLGEWAGRVKGSNRHFLNC